MSPLATARRCARSSRCERRATPPWNPARRSAGGPRRSTESGSRRQTMSAARACVAPPRCRRLSPAGSTRKSLCRCRSTRGPGSWCGGFDLPSVVTLVKKILCPCTIGDDHPRPGISVTHSMFSVLLHFSGRVRLAAVGLASGPRKAGHARSAVQAGVRLRRASSVAYRAQASIH